MALFTVAACGGGGSGSGDSGDIIDVVLRHLNASTGAVYQGTTVIQNEPSSTPYTGLSCFSFPTQSREEFVDRKSIRRQSETGVCFGGGGGCYEIDENVLLIGDSTLNVLTESGGHVVANLDFISGAIAIRVEERSMDAGASCGSPDSTTFADLNGTYTGRIYSIAEEGGDNLLYRPLRSPPLSLICSTDSCTLGENDFLMSETSSNTFREAADGGDILKGEFLSKDGTTTYHFVGAASTLGRVVGGIAYPEVSEGEAFDCASECLVLVFEK